MKKEKRARISSIMALIFLVALALLPGCQKEQQQDGGDGDSGTLTFSYFRPLWGASTYVKDGPYEKALEEAANVKINVQIVPVGEYDAKAQIMLSSKKFPDVMWALGPVDASWRGTENQGAFYPIEELLESHPAVKATAADDIWEMMRNEDGHIYFLPNTTSSEIPFYLYYRKDWFDELGIAEPTTIAELEKALEQLKVAKSEVIPMTVGNGEVRWMFKDLATSFGAVINTWQPSKEDPNTLIPSFSTEEQKEYLFWLQKMRSRGLLDAEADLNPDFSHGKQKFMTGKAACYPGGYPDMLEIYPQLLANDPDAEIGIMSPLTGPDGTKGGLRVNFPVDRGMYFNASLSAEKIEKIFDFLEWTLTDGHDLYYYGIEDKMCVVNEDGTKSKIPESMREDAYKNAQVEPLKFLSRREDLVDFADYEDQFEALGLGQYYENWRAKWDEYCANKYYDYLVPTVKSETNTKIGSQIQESCLNSTFGAVILSPDVTKKQYDDAVSAWLAAGGQDIIDEFNAAQTEKTKPTY